MPDGSRFHLIAVALLTCASSCLAQGRVARVNPIQRLMEQPFNDPIYSKPFFNSLSSPQSITFAKEIGWQVRTPVQLANLARRFPLPMPLQGHVNVELRTFVSKQEKSPHMILMGILERLDDEHTPAGSFSVVLKHAKNGELESHIGAVYFDRADPRISGIAPAMLRFLKDEVYPVVGVTRETLKADHAGRYVWAKQGFQFDPTYWFKDVGGRGPPIKLPELARRNFARFLNLHGLAIQDLALHGRPLASLEELQSPDDFASVTHRRSKKLTIQPFILGVLQPFAALDVGKAFMLADYRPQGGRFVLSMARTKFSPTAMPYWNGWRKP